MLIAHAVITGTSVTGSSAISIDGVQEAVDKIRLRTKLPIGVGFGISTPDQAAAVSRFADAAVVGTALMRVVDAARGTDHVVEDAAAFIRGIKGGMRDGKG